MAIEAEHSSGKGLDERVPGTRLAASRGRAWKDLLVQVYERHPRQASLLIPAVPEPLIVWILSGQAMVEERELGGGWQAHQVTEGDFFLTNARDPYELRWTTDEGAPFEVMHLHLGLPLLKRATTEILGENCEVELRDVSGERDTVLSALLEALRAELMSTLGPSAMFVQGLAQSLAVHLVRQYGTVATGRQRARGGLPAFKLRRVIDLMESQLDRDFHLARLARDVGLSEFHFGRAFKQSTGYPPSRYFIRLRMERARQLLRETSRSIIEIGLEVGYTSASHFAQVFRRETGVAPSDYRGDT